MADNFFAKVPATVRQDRRLTDLDLRIFVELAAYCNSSNECWYSNSKIAENIGKHRNSVSRSISRLVEFGHITIGEYRPGMRSISIVGVNRRVDSVNPTVEGVNPTVEGGSTLRWRGGKPYGGPEEREEKKEKRRREQPLCDDPDFETFWKAYPKKNGRLDALRAWKKTAKDRPPLPELLAIVAFWKTRENWTKDNGRYVKDPAAWLNGHRWDDDQTNAVEDERARAERVYENIRNGKIK